MAARFPTLAVVLACLAPAQEPVRPLDADALRKLWAAVVPEGPETWETIPWRTDLDAAQREAAAGARPMFLWTMNGHPLGCT